MPGFRFAVSISYLTARKSNWARGDYRQQQPPVMLLEMEKRRVATTHPLALVAAQDSQIIEIKTILQIRRES